MAKRLLLIEDEKFISFIYKRQLEIAGFEVDTAGDGLSGLELVQKSQYDLVLLDIMMPGMNGVDVLRAIKNNEKTKNIPVIMITNLAQDEIMNQTLKLGAAAYWIKANMSPTDIVNGINTLFASDSNIKSDL